MIGTRHQNQYTNISMKGKNYALNYFWVVANFSFSSSANNEENV